MATLTSALINKLVTTTNDSSSASASSTTAYGTVVVSGSSYYVRLDGSETLTPVTNADSTTVRTGDRVIVTIQNHVASVTSNLTTTATLVSTEDTENTSDLALRVAALEAAMITSDYLEQYYASIESLTNSSADLDVNTLKSKAITVETLAALEIDVTTLTADTATVKYLTAEALEASIATFGYVKATELEADVATFGYVKTTELEAEVANIGFLTADTIVANGITVKSLIANVANIETILSGSIGTGTLQSIHITSDNVVIDEAVITSAMIVDLAASKLTAGTIYTDYIKIANNEGQNLWIDGSTIQINDGTYVRVQIGEDASGDYNLYLWDSSGTLLWDAKGLTESGLIGNGAIIKDAAVADDAAISGSKLDIASVASRLNEDGSLTVDYSMVTIDDTTLSAWYTSVNTNITELGSTTSTLQTNLTVVQGQIETKVWQTDIDSAIGNIVVGGRNYLLGTKDFSSGTSESYITDETYNNFTIAHIDNTDVSTSTYNDIAKWISVFEPEPDTYYTLSFWAKGSGRIINYLYPNAVASGENDSGNTTTSADGNIATTLNENWTRHWVTWKTLSSVFGMKNVIAARVYGGNECYICGVKFEQGNIATDWTAAPEDTEEALETIHDSYAELVLTIDGVTSTVGDLKTTVGDNYEELTNQISVISQTATDIKSELSATYATITYADKAASDAESAAEGYTDNLLASYYTMSQVNSITQTITEEINQIKLDVADTYFTQSDAATLQSTLESSITANTTSITAEVTRATSAESTLSAADTKYGTCSTGAGTAAKVVSCSSFTTLSAGALICVYFTYANTATSPTLNVNSTGAKTIYAYGAAIASGSDYNWTAKSYVNFMYDGTHWVLIDAGASSKITMLADSISLEVTSGTGGTASIVLSVDGETSDSVEYVTSAREAFEAEDSSITISAGTITFNSNTLVMNSTNCSISATGIITASSVVLSGTMTTTSGNYTTKLTTGGLRFYYDDSLYGSFSSTTWNEKIGIAMHLTSESYFMSFSRDDDGDNVYTAAYYISYSTAISSYRHNFDGTARFSSAVTMSSTLKLGSTLYMSNGNSICWADSDGVSAPMMYLSSSDYLQIGNTTYCDSIYLRTAGRVRLLCNGSSTYYEIPQIYKGSMTITPSAANTPTSKTLTLSNGMAGTPEVFLTLGGDNPGTVILGTSVSGRSSTGFTCWVTRTNTSDTTVMYLMMY